MRRLRLQHALLAALTLLFGLHVLRVFLPTVIWYLGQYLDAEGLVLYALATFALMLLAPFVRRWLGENHALALAAGGLALVRLAIQLARAPLADLVLATIGLGLLGWFFPLWCQSHRNCPGGGEGPVLAVAFPLAFLLDTGSRSLLLSYDLAWQKGWGATLVVLGLVGLALALLWQELARRPVEEPAQEPSLRYVLPWVGLGPWLYVATSVTHNPAALVAATSWGDIPAHAAVNGLTIVGAVVCVGVANWPALQRRRWALLGGALAVVALVFLVTGVGPGWLWLGLVSFNSWAALGEVLTSTARVGALRPGLWRSSLVTFLALTLMLAIVILVTEYDVLWMTPVAGLLLAAAAFWGTRVDAGRNGDTLRAQVATVGPVAVGVLVGVGVWAFFSPRPQIVDVPPGDRSLRVMVYNIHQGLDADRAMDLQAIADVIAAENPDVIVLNEVNRARASNGFVDTLSLIGHRLRMSYVFGPNYLDGQYGNALLSRYPVLEWDNTHYHHNSTEIRGLLRAVVQTGGGPLTFYATHLDHLSGPGNVRAEQVDEALARWSGAPRTVLLGDLNAQPDAPELQAIYQSGFVDVLAAAGQDDVFTYWDPKSSRRIDFIFLTPDLSLNRAWVVPSRASDHLPVLAEVGP
jgi:endonuclease/exonuclease/phosphatase family metal-dependent hydrolase